MAAGARNGGSQVAPWRPKPEGQQGLHHLDLWTCRVCEELLVGFSLVPALSTKT